MTALEKVQTAVVKVAQLEAALQDMLGTDNTLLFALGVDPLEDIRKTVQKTQAD